jgi:hypothetical protein
MVLQRQTDQGIGQDGFDHALHRYPERLDARGGMQTQKRFFDDGAECCFCGRVLHLNPFPTDL